MIPEILKINHVEINHGYTLYHVHHPNLREYPKVCVNLQTDVR